MKSNVWSFSFYFIVPNHFDFNVRKKFKKSLLKFQKNEIFRELQFHSTIHDSDIVHVNVSIAKQLQVDRGGTFELDASSMTGKIKYLEKYSVAPSPSRDYYGLKVLRDQVLTNGPRSRHSAS